MATTKLYLDKRSRKNDGTYPLKLSISQRGTSSLIPLDVWLTDDTWDPERQQVKVRPDKQSLNGYISRRRIEIEDILRELTLSGSAKGKSATELRKLVLSAMEPEVEERKVLFLDYFVSYMNRHENARTREIYKATIDWIRRYDRNADSLHFEDIRKVWLDRFFQAMALNSPSVNARNIHLRNIRAVFNDAIDAEVTTAYPFRKYKIHPVPTQKRNLPVDELRSVFSAEVPSHRRKYKDAFRLMFLLIGINVADLCKLNKESVNDGRLSYIRSKTHRPYNIKIEPEAAELIDLYAGEKDHLLRFAEGITDYRHFAAKLNENLKEIRPGITTYTARHSWATIAASLDIPKETIAQALGHGGNSVTDIYIEFDIKKVDEANRRVIDWVFYGKM